MPHRTFDLAEVAEYLHISQSDVERLVHHGEIPFEQQGKRVVFRQREVDAWASQRILGLGRAGLENYHRGSSVGAHTKRGAQAHPLRSGHAIVAELIRPECIDPAMASRTRPAVLRDMAGLAEKSGLVTDPEGLLESLRQREELCSTGVPGGLALLHPRHHDPYLFSDSFLALARAAQPVHFGAPDTRPTNIFFLIGCQDDRIHLHVLARLCMMCQETDMLQRLREDPGAGLLNVLVAAEREVIGKL